MQSLRSVLVSADIDLHSWAAVQSLTHRRDVPQEAHVLVQPHGGRIRDLCLEANLVGTGARHGRDSRLDEPLCQATTAVLVADCEHRDVATLKTAMLFQLRHDRADRHVALFCLRSVSIPA